MSTTVLTLRLDAGLKKQLDKLASATQRSRSFLAAEAIREYIALNNWQIEEIKKAVKEADRGDFAAERDVQKVMKKWTPECGLGGSARHWRSPMPRRNILRVIIQGLRRRSQVPLPRPWTALPGILQWAGLAALPVRASWSCPALLTSSPTASAAILLKFSVSFTQRVNGQEALRSLNRTTYAFWAFAAAPLCFS